MNQRRDFLKMFGVGATIIPVIAGVADITMPARLIAEPIVEPVKLATVRDMNEAVQQLNGPMKGQMSIMIDVVGKSKHLRLNASSALIVTHEGQSILLQDGLMMQYGRGHQDAVRL